MELGLAIVAIFLFLYAVSSRRLSVTIFTGPLLFASLGWILGSEGLEVVETPIDAEISALLLEGTLVLVLFTDAMRVNTSRWREEASLPVRLLGIGLPLTVVSGWLLALLLFSDLEFWEAGLVAIILTPTDAALGQAVVSNPRVPERIRQGLNVESGLNDGIALPIFFVMLEAAEVAEASISLWTVLSEVAKGVAIALVVGIALGWAASRVIAWAFERDWIAGGWSQVSLLAVAFAAWSLGDALGGSGFLAAWASGLIVGRELRGKHPNILDYAEDTGHLLTLLSFFLFGNIALGVAFRDLTWEVGVYAVLSLTLIRILPVAIAMIGAGMRAPSILYLGWFGPRGLASIILVLTIVVESNLPGASTIALVMAATVGLSIYAHGVTAWWGSNRYADWYESRSADHGEMAESAGVPQLPVSRRLGPIAPSDPKT